MAVSLFRRVDGSEPLRPDPMETVEERRNTRSVVMATGSFACPACDAPVLPDGPMGPADPVACPFCLHPRAVRDFLSLSAPVRPARVAVRIRQPARVL